MPKPTSGLTALGLDVTACHGGFSVLEWSAAPADGFHHYQALRSSSSSIAAEYPPEPPAVAPDSLYATDRGTLSAIDAGREAGTTDYYRTVAFGAEDVAYAASDAVGVTAKAVKALGSLDAVVEGSSVSVSWAPYGGPGTCFSASKLVVSTTDETPTYGEGADALWSSESQSASSASVDGLAQGTYHLRLQSFRLSEAGKLLVAQTGVATVTIP
jgi:hypothetical protein